MNPLLRDKKMSLSPVVLFTYKRLDTLQQTVSSLQKNRLSNETELFIFSDGPKDESEVAVVNEIREYLSDISGFKKVFLHYSDNNKGLANSVIEGVTKMLGKYDSTIILEDDLIVSSNFLEFMNQALDFYRGNRKMFSVAGFSFPIRQVSHSDVYFTRRASSWGWGTWSDKWANIDWDVRDYDSFRRSVELRRGFNMMGSDMSRMLDKQVKGIIDSWAIRWCYHQFKYDLLTVHPNISKVLHKGMGRDATNVTGQVDRYKTTLDKSDNRSFHFQENPSFDPRIIKQFTKHYSVGNRIRYKILNYLRRGL